MDHIAVFGIGSTHCRYTVANSRGDFVIDITVEPTRPHELPAQLIAAVEDMQAIVPHALDAVGVACTGLVDTTADEIRDLDTPSGTTIDRIDIGTPMGEAHDLPVYLINDCNAAALGEWYYGARTNQDSLVHVTFGTGIGGGIVEQGQLLRGHAGQAGEFGLLPVAPQSDLTSTGVTGAWEAICSGRGIPQYVAQRIAREDDVSYSDELDSQTSLVDNPDAWTAEDIFTAADEGDAVAQDCLAEIAQYNAAGIGAICNAVNPGLITIGGGVALNNQEWILDAIETSLDDYLFVERPNVQLTSLGDDIGLYGALATYLVQSPNMAAEAMPQSTRSKTD